MPLYEYRCSKCGKTFEVLQKFSDAPLKKHPGCGGKVEKLISASGFHLKGSGWYATDYAKGSGKEAKAQGKGDGKADVKSDSKGAETKAESSKTESAKTESKTDSKPAPAASKKD